MALSWMERAEQKLEDGLTLGHITQKEYNQGLRDIQAEHEEQRENAGQEFREGWDG